MTNYIVYCNDCDEVVSEEPSKEEAAATFTGHAATENHRDILIRRADRYDGD